MHHNEYDLDGGLNSGLGSLLDSLNWDHVRSEVAEEGRARVAIVGLPGAGKSTLLNSLRGWEVSPVHSPTAPDQRQEDLGLFLLLDLPCEGPAAGDETAGMGGNGLGPSLWDLLAQADMIVFLFDGALHLDEQGGQGADDLNDDPVKATKRRQHLAEYQWYCRIKTLGPPVTAILSKSDLLEQQERQREVASALAQRLVTTVTPLCALQGDTATQAVLLRLLEANPKLLVALGRELPAIRRQAATQVINQTTLFAALAGLQPVPLLDLPLQLGLQMRMLLRLDALYGRSQQSDTSRELDRQPGWRHGSAPPRGDAGQVCAGVGLGHQRRVEWTERMAVGLGRGGLAGRAPLAPAPGGGRPGGAAPRLWSCGCRRCRQGRWAGGRRATVRRGRQRPQHTYTCVRCKCQRRVRMAPWWTRRLRATWWWAQTTWQRRRRTRAKRRRGRGAGRCG